MTTLIEVGSKSMCHVISFPHFRRIGGLYLVGLLFSKVHLIRHTLGEIGGRGGNFKGGYNVSTRGLSFQEVTTLSYEVKLGRFTT